MKNSRYQRDAMSDSFAPMRAALDMNALVRIADAVRSNDVDPTTITPAQLDAMASAVARLTGENASTLRSRHPAYLATRLAIAVRAASSSANRGLDALASLVEDPEVRERAAMIDRTRRGAGSRAGTSQHDTAPDGQDDEARERTLMINRTRRKGR